MGLHDAFGAELRRVFFRWRGRFDAELKAAGQTLARARVLGLLAPERDGLPQRELAALLSVEHPTLVRLLDGLERQGLLARHQTEGDRRSNRVVLTEAAAPVAAEVTSLSNNLRDRALRGIGDNDLAIALEVLRTITRNLDECSSPETGR